MDGYDVFIKQMKARTGIDLSLYKEEQMKRRLTSLKNKYHLESFQDYFNLISRDENLLEECLDRMTINVSGFFRNKKRWDILDKTILPEIIQKRKGRRLKVWSAACSTGEEPYTLSIILARHLPVSEFEILATDIDEKALQKAMLGSYDERSLNECTEEERKDYFHQEGTKFRIKRNFQAPIKFQKQNLLEGRYQKSFDLIVCRNVLIYFTEDAKDDIYRGFADSLNPCGYLFIGSTEQIFHPQTYQLQSVTTFFYQKSVKTLHTQSIF